MTSKIALAFLFSALPAVVLTYIAARLLDKWQVMDVPNNRSSHKKPTPRGGGIAIVGVSSLGIAISALCGLIPAALTLSLLCGGICVALIGLLDDLVEVPAYMRLVVQVFAASIAIYFMDGSPVFRIGATVVPMEGLWNVVSVVFIVWLTNLFNFMDGVDGLAASEATFIFLTAAALLAAMAAPYGIVLVLALIAGSCAGFLVINWPPASVFMGDVGSGFLGFMIAVSALNGATITASAIPIWIVLGALFFADSTVTLLRRMANGERFYEPHHNHLYQRLARRYRSHKKVTIGFAILNISILLPIGVLCSLVPAYAMSIAAIAVTFIGVCFFFLGAGRAADDEEGY